MESSTKNHTGFLLVNKPQDWTSHDVIAYLRKVTGIKKIGHAGTLDPFATGLLIVGVGREATKQLDKFKTMKKKYTAIFKFGAVSDTYDRTGKIQRILKKIDLTETKVQNTLKIFEGKQNQLPPMYSAKKIGGKKLYEYARKGIEIERTKHHIHIYDLEFVELNGQLLTLNIICSPGTYIRTLAHDMGQALAKGAYCEELTRTAIGTYTIDNAIDPKQLTTNNYHTYIIPSP